MDLVGSYFEFFWEMKVKIGFDIIGLILIEERDEKLKYVMMILGVLYLVFILFEVEYKVGIY